MNTRRLIFVSIICIGVSSVSAQLIMVREFLSSVEGNELVIGLILFFWLLFTGLGSFLARFARRPSMAVYGWLTFAIGVMVLLMTLGVRYGRDVIFTYGASPGLYSMVWFIAPVISLYCLIVGFILPYGLIQIRPFQQDFTSGRLYLLDSIGDILGGALFSFFLIYFLTPFQIIAATSVWCVIIAGAMLWNGGMRKSALAAAGMGMLFLGACLHPGFELATLAARYTSPIVDYVESRYGRIIVTEDSGQYNFFFSGTPLFSSHNVQENEELIHYPMSQRKEVKSVLLVSGGLGGAMDEVIKHHPRSVDYVEIDPEVIRAAEKFHLFSPSNIVTVHLTDGRAFIFSTGKKFDVIIVDLPDPDTFQLNRFYTSEFFARVKRVLNSGGVLSFSLSYYENYISDVEKHKLAALYATVSLYFKHVLILPGERAYFLCSDEPLSPHVVRLLNEKGVKTSYISGYFEGNVTPERIQKLMDAVKSVDSPAVNTDFSPSLLSIVFSQWFAKHQTSPLYALVGVLAAFAAYTLLLRRGEFVLLTTGMATMGAEIVLIFCFQIMYGYIYLQVGAIVTAFLAGLAPGALAGNRIKKRRGALLLSECALIASLIGYGVLLNLVHTPLPRWFFLGFGFQFAFWCGFQFPLITGLMGEDTSPAAGCFAADMAGAALGTLLLGVVIIPLWGIFPALAFTAALKLISLTFNLFTSVKAAEYTS